MDNNGILQSNDSNTSVYEDSKQKYEESKDCTTFMKNIFGSSIICPISHQIMQDPVIDPTSGRSFERLEIYRWLQTSNISPLTRIPVDIDHLISNVSLKNVIQEISDNRIKIIKNILNKYENKNKENKKNIRGRTSRFSSRRTNMIQFSDIKSNNVVRNENAISMHPVENKIIVENVPDIFQVPESSSYINSMRKGLSYLLCNLRLNGKDDFRKISNTVDCFTGCRFAYDIMHNDSLRMCHQYNKKHAFWPNQAVVYAIEDGIRLNLSIDNLKNLHGINHESIIHPTNIMEIVDNSDNTTITSGSNNGGYVQTLIKLRSSLYVRSARIYLIWSIKSLIYKGNPLFNMLYNVTNN